MNTTPTQKQSETLEPCPFTGIVPFIRKCRPNSHKPYFEIFISHKENAYQIRVVADTEEELIRLWNTRAQPSETPVAEKVREALNIADNAIAYLSSTLGKKTVADAVLCGEVRDIEDVRYLVKEAIALLDQQAASHVCDETCGGAINSRHCGIASQSDLLSALRSSVEGMIKELPEHSGAAIYELDNIRSLVQRVTNVVCQNILMEIDELLDQQVAPNFNEVIHADHCALKDPNIKAFAACNCARGQDPLAALLSFVRGLREEDNCEDRCYSQIAQSARNATLSEVEAEIEKMMGAK